MNWLDTKPGMISRRISISLLLIFLFPLLLSAQQKQRFTYSSRHMGTTFRIVLYAESQIQGDSASTAAFRKVEHLNSILSDYDPNSELNQLSRTSGKDTVVAVSDPLFEVLQKAQEVSRRSSGAFDVTVGPYVELWRQMNRQSEPTLPSRQTLNEAEQRVGYRFVELNKQDHTVRLTRQGMQLDLGGIAKGYAVDEALAVLQKHGIHSALVDGGGDIVLGEAPPGKKGWNIEVVSHDSSGVSERMMLLLENRAVATSGDLYQHVEIGGTRYSHIIDPRTGLGLTDRRQVTIIAPDGITADSYASVASVLTPAKALELIKTLPDVVVFIEQNDAGEIQRWRSKGFEQLLR